MSSMRSASSSTRNWMQHREIRPRSIRSTKRPGVATSRSQPRSSSRTWPLSGQNGNKQKIEEVVGCGTHVAQALAETSWTKNPLGEHIFHRGTTAEGQSLLHALTAKPSAGTRGAGKAMHNLPHRLGLRSKQNTPLCEKKKKTLHPTVKNDISRQALLIATFHVPPNEGRAALSFSYPHGTKTHDPTYHMLTEPLCSCYPCPVVCLFRYQHCKIRHSHQFPSLHGGKNDKRRNTRFYPPTRHAQAGQGNVYLRRDFILFTIARRREYKRKNRRSLFATHHALLGHKTNN